MSVCYRACRWAGGLFPRPVPVPHIIQGVLGIRFTHIHYTCNMQVFQLFLPVFAAFRAFLHCFPHFWPPGPTCRAEPAAGTQNQGAGRPRGAATPTQGGLWPPPHRAGPPARSAAAESAGGSRADRGQRDPGAERPPGGQPGRSGQRGSASTVEGTAGPGRRDRLPRTPGGPDRRRGGRRVGDSGAGGQRPGGPQADRPRKRAGPGTGAAGRIPR